LAVGTTAPATNAQSGRPERNLSVKTPVQGRSSDTIEVKFRDTASLRLRGQTLVSPDGSEPHGIAGVLARHGQPQLTRLFTAEERQLDAESQRLRAARTDVANLNQYVRLKLRPGESVEATVAELLGQPEVETAYPAPLAVPSPTTPNLTAAQGYRSPS